MNPYIVFNADNYSAIDLILARLIGINESLLYSCLMAFRKNREWFPAPAKLIEIKTALTEHQQYTAFDNLFELGLVATKLEGFPRQRHAKICEDGVQWLMEEYESAGTRINTSVPHYAELVEDVNTSVPHDEELGFAILSEEDARLKSMYDSLPQDVSNNLSVTYQYIATPSGGARHEQSALKKVLQKEEEKEGKKERKESTKEKKERKQEKEEEKDIDLNVNKDLQNQISHDSEAYKFALWFKTDLIDEAKKPKISENDLQNWAKCYLILIGRKHTKMEIVRVCQWARQDDFWKSNFYTPCKLVRKSKTMGIWYMDKFVEEMRKAIDAGEFRV